MSFKLPTPKGYDPEQFAGRKPRSRNEEKPEPELESNSEPTYSDDLGIHDLRLAIEDYQQWCAENYDCLNVDLSEIPVEVSTKLKKTAGKVNWIKGSDKINYIRYAYKAYKKWGWEQFAETIRHELIHVHTVQNHKRGGHGKLFKQLVEPMETHRHCESFSTDEAKYHLFCKECDELVAHKFRRSKTVKNPDKYQSKCCKATLRVETNQ